LYPEKVFYEPAILTYELGKQLKTKFENIPWIPIESHNNIEELRKNPNRKFIKMKRYLVIGVRKSLKYTANHKVSDFLVPYTSSGCSAMCLYCYLVCNYNKCSYLRLFVNREQMMDKLIKTANRSEKDIVFEIGSNSDLVLENTITGNLEWTIELFGKSEKGFITFPTKFDMVEPLLPLNHRGRVIMRMSVNPEEIIRKIEFGTSSLKSRITALNRMCDAGLVVKYEYNNKYLDVHNNFLSRGTLEQIYLALRLAFVEHLDPGGDPLPVFLDEVFVNWDGFRLNNGIGLLNEMANERQVFIFTCHDWLVEKLAGNIQIQVVEL
jgi:hypothetical protein